MDTTPSVDVNRRKPEFVTGLGGTGQPETTAHAGERRESVREVCGGAIWWKGRENDQFQQGWLIEQSTGGAAFLVKGKSAPLQGTRIEVSTSDPTDIGFRVEEGFVTRMTHVHADLFLVAATLRPSA